MRKLAKSSSRSIRRSDEEGRILVWDRLVRIFHWSLLACFGAAWLTSDSAGIVHQLTGYAAFGLVVLRVFWGFVGAPYARFSQFVRHPGTIWRYLGAVIRGRGTRYLGHNPVGGAMIVVLLATMIGTAVSGYATTTDRFWGVGWVSDLHSVLAHGLLVLILFHFAGVLLASFRHRENLIAAMMSGYKRPPGPHDVA